VPAGHAGGRHRWRLAVSFGLIAAFFGVELVFGLLSGSLALLSDAGRMAADVVALSAALVATRIATRRTSPGGVPTAHTGPKCSPPAWRCC
jgi:cobalt-zinc-cadmium efflux system protein